MKKPLLLLLALALVLPLIARAADDPAAAREHYHRASKLYDLQRYHDAAKEFEAAYEAKGDPAFLYNIGQSYRLAGEAETSVGAYRSYLRRTPKAPNRAEVEERIIEMQTIIDAQKKSRESEPAGMLRPGQTPSSTPSDEMGGTAVDRPAAHPGGASETRAPVEAPKSAGQGSDKGTGARPGFGKKVGGAVVMGAGVVAVGIGIALGLQASSASDQLSHPMPGQVFDPALEDSFKTNQAASIGLLVGGGAAVAGGAVLFILGLREGRTAPVSVLPIVGRGHAGAALSFRF